MKVELSKVKVTVDCIHCKVFEPTEEEQRAIISWSLVGGGFTCPRCNDECHVRFGEMEVTSVSKLVMLLDLRKGK